MKHLQSIARRILSLSAFATILAVSAGARAQCQPVWQAAPSSYTFNENVNGAILCSTVWDPDGTGPLNPALVIGGAFTAIGAGTLNHIAMWDGTTWKSLFTGTNGLVLALTVDTSTNTLIAGGQFTTAGGVACNKIARFNGTSWSALGSGVTGDGVYALAYNAEYNEIYLGGSFSTAGGVSTGSVARYNGTYHIAGGTLPGYVYGLMYDAPSRNLYMAGKFAGGVSPNVGRYNAANQTWYGMSSGLPGFGAFTLAWHWNGSANELICGGLFDTASGSPCNNIARWTGSAWAPMSTGLSGAVRSLIDFNGSLLAFGSFTSTSQGVAANHIAAWNNTSWVSAGPGVNGTVDSAVVYKGLLHVSGDFTQAAGISVPHLAAFDGSNWSALRSAPSGPVRAFLANGTGFVMGGQFDMRDATGVSARNIAVCSGSAYSAIQNLTGFNGVNGPVNALMFKSNGITIGSTYVGGLFTTAGGSPALNVASTSVSEWSPVGSGVDGEVFAMASYGCTALGCGTVVTGNFTHSGADSCAYIARWGPGTATRNLGSGLNGPGKALAVYNGELYVGGTFNTAGGLLTGALARWNGSTWNNVGGTFGGEVNALCVYDNYLAIGGLYGGIGSPNIALWNSVAGGYWPIGQGFNGRVRALTVHNGDLYAAGDFTLAGTIAVNHIAHFSRITNQWEAVGSGADGPIYAMISRGDTLWIGGNFLRVGSLYSPYLAQAKCACYANCDNSTSAPTLNINDFQCFLNQFAAGQSLTGPQQVFCYANCDASTVTPVLNINDFQCYLNKFAAGCN